MNPTETLNELCEKLEKDLKESPPALMNPPVLTIEPITEFDDLLTDEAKAATSKKFNKVIGPTKPEYKTVFLSTTVKSKDKLKAAATAIANEINTLASLGKILGVLAPLSKLRLARKWMLNGEFVGWQDVDSTNHFGDLGMSHVVPEGAILEADNWAVFCFVTVPWDFEPAFMEECLKLRYYAAEGAVGEEFSEDE